MGGCGYLNNANFRDNLIKSTKYPNPEILNHGSGRILWGTCLNGLGAWYLIDTKIYEGKWDNNGNLEKGRIYKFSNFTHCFRVNLERIKNKDLLFDSINNERIPK